jgi:4-hydroxy-tetrahydrodipicolinate synthase
MRFPGILPAVTTPFDADDTVDVGALQSNVEAMLEAGVHGFVACGTMGEAGSLTPEERRTVISAVVEATAGRGPVIAGVSSGSAAASLAYAADAAAAGADAIMCLPPLGYRADPDEVVAFFSAVASCGLPLMAYNNPEASGVDMRAELIVRIAEEVEGVAAIKECSGDARRIAHIGELSDVAVLVGGDDWALEGFAAGAVGWVSGVANVLPAECLELQRLVEAGDLPAARELWPRLAPLARLDMDPRLVQSFKAALDIKGMYGGPVRPPRLPLEDRSPVEAACRS